MKNIIISGLLMLFCFACKDNSEQEPSPDTDASFITAQKLSTMRIAEMDLQVKLIAVSDSRCPINAYCITAGIADLTFQISNSATSADVRVTFAGLDKEKGNRQDFILGGTTYQIQVSEVLPYPENSKKTELDEYKVSATIYQK